MKLYLKLSICIALFIMSTTANAQTETTRTPKKKLEIDGSIAASTDGKAVYFNLGGPALNFGIKKFQFSINMLPSIGITALHTSVPSAYGTTNKTRLNATPVLGTGLQFYYKRAIFCIPFYYRFASNTWVGTVGVGYKIFKF